MYAKPVYIALLVINNILGIFFLGLLFLSTPAFSPNGTGYSSERKFYWVTVLYVAFVSVAFSLISLWIRYLFRNKVRLTGLSMLKAFSLQVIFFFFAFLLLGLGIFIRFKTLAD